MSTNIQQQTIHMHYKKSALRKEDMKQIRKKADCRTNWNILYFIWIFSK